MSTTIYVALLDEAVEVWRPVLAEPLGGDRYLIVEQPYNTEDERWEFLPGEEVVCGKARLSSGQVLVARRRAS